MGDNFFYEGNRLFRKIVGVPLRRYHDAFFRIKLNDLGLGQELELVWSQQLGLQTLNELADFDLLSLRVGEYFFLGFGLNYF